MNRRHFPSGSVAAAGAARGSHVIGRNDTIRIACVGCRGREGRKPEQHRRVTLAALSLCAWLCVGGGPYAQNNEVAWVADILEATQPERVKMGGRGTFGPIGLSDSKEPPENHKWLALAVRLKPPKQGAGLQLQEIKAFDDSTGAHPVAAIAPGAKVAGATFMDLEAVAGSRYAFYEKSGQLIWAISTSDQTGGLHLSVQREQTAIVLLFAVPASAKRLRLAIGDEVRIPVTTSKRPWEGTNKN